jgi:thymidine phosphorylase
MEIGTADPGITTHRPTVGGDRLRRLGIDTGAEHVVYLHHASPICRSEGLGAHARVQLQVGERQLLATLAIVHGELLEPDEAGLSESAWSALQPQPHEHAVIAHPASVESLACVRAKIYGQTLDDAQLHGIVRDIVAHRYSHLELAAFITACSGDHLTTGEVIALTRAMVDTGTRLRWPQPTVVDKHCIGGLAGNRTTPIVVAIVTALGLVMPKTSSRAITSPAGTADTMAMLAPVQLDLARMRHTVERCGGCIVWGGAMNLAPADDVLIRVERALDVDSVGQLVASVLSKKLAAGSTHVVIDVPVGPTAKIRSDSEAGALKHLLEEVAAAFGLQLRVLLSDGREPIGRGIGPALEAHDVLAVLQNHADAPADLRARALQIAAAVLELGGVASTLGAGAVAAECLDSGRAWVQFQAICTAQGGLRVPGSAPWQQPVLAPRDGVVTAIDNRRLSRVAKLAGAPSAPLAGLTLQVHGRDRVSTGQPLFTVHAQSPGELAYAMEYVARHPAIVTLEDAP